MVATSLMKRPVLTKAFCETAPAGRHCYARLTGFGPYVGQSGARTFFVEYRPGHGRSVAKRRMSLGTFGPLTAEEGRRLAKQRLGEIANGVDPLAKRQEEKRRVGQRFETIVDDWLARDQQDNRSFCEIERLLRRDVVPAFQGLQIEAIRKRDIIQLLDSIADRGSPVMANRTLASMRRLFRWAVERDLLDVDPSAGIGKRNVERSRDRVLSDDEVVAIWRAASAMGAPYGIGIRLLLCSGARREEIFGAQWCEFDRIGATIELPARVRNETEQHPQSRTGQLSHSISSARPS